jgi:pSer/pThr/pTyr-binding forkhead associated (FHA) protein
LGCPAIASTAHRGRRRDANLECRPELAPEGKATVFCTRCGHRNRDDARFCAECGAPLQDDSTVSLTPIEGEEEEPSEFPFPEDELEPGQALLQVKRGPNAGSTFLLDADASTVGRNPESDVFLDDVTVSRKHATFERRSSGEWFVRDAGSLNGTYVNGEQVDETKLARGDLVQIGRFKLVFFQAEGADGRDA